MVASVAASNLLVQVPVLLLRVQSTASRPGTVDWVDRTDASVTAKPSVLRVVCKETAHDIKFSVIRPHRRANFPEQALT